MYIIKYAHKAKGYLKFIIYFELSKRYMNEGVQCSENGTGGSQVCIILQYLDDKKKHILHSIQFQYALN